MRQSQIEAQTATGEQIAAGYGLGSAKSNRLLRTEAEIQEYQKAAGMTWLQRYWDWDRRLPHTILRRLGIAQVTGMWATVLTCQFFAK